MTEEELNDPHLLDSIMQHADVVFSVMDAETMMHEEMVKDSMKAFDNFVRECLMKRFDVRPELGNPLEDTLLKVRESFYKDQNACGWQLEFSDYMERVTAAVKFLFEQ